MNSFLYKTFSCKSEEDFKHMVLDISEEKWQYFFLYLKIVGFLSFSNINIQTVEGPKHLKNDPGYEENAIKLKTK